MKLKYKKIILLTIMSTMGIGLLTISLGHDKTDAKESLSLEATANTDAIESTAVENDGETNTKLAAAMMVDPTTIPTPTEVPTPTPLPVYAIEKEGYPEIEQLIKDYYTAKNNRDVKALKALLSDSDKADSQEELQKKTEYIDDYRNIKIYTKKGFKEGTYIVYAYHEIKFTSINTPAPGLAKFYIVTGEDGKLKIFSGVMDAETQSYYDQRNSDEDVIKLIDMTDKKSDKAIKSDEDLLNFWKNIDEMAGNTSKDKTNAQGDTN